MNYESQLRLQAYLDGELSRRETAAVHEWITRDNDARLLLAELQTMKTALAGNDLQRALPESHDFFWSKVRGEIERLDRQPAARGWLPWWQPSHVRSLVRFALVGCVAALMFLVVDQRKTAPYAHLGEIESSTEEMGSITFRSEAHNMTVVYLFDHEPAVVADISLDKLPQ